MARRISLFFATPSSLDVHRSGLLGSEEPVDDLRRLAPVAGFRLQSLSARFRERVEFRPPVVIGGAPVRGDRAFLFELDQDGIERALD